MNLDSLFGNYGYPRCLKERGFTALTIPGLFGERCSKTPHQVALRVKEFGIYQNITWQEYYDHVESLGLGLLELGMEPGDRVAIMSDPCPEWLYSELAAQCVGGISYGIYPTSSPSETEYLMQKGGAKFLVAQDQEFVDKVLPTADRLPNLRRIIVVDTQVMFLYGDPRIISFYEVKEIGHRRKKREPEFFKEMISRVKEKDIATIIWTSGTTGLPKGTMESQHNIVSGHIRFIDFAGKYLQENDREVAYLPLAHVFARVFDEYIPIVAGYQVYFGEDVALMQETLFDVSPTIMIATPRILEKLSSQVLIGIDSSVWIKRIAYKIAMWIGRRVLEQRWKGKYLTLYWRLANFISKRLAFRPILDKLGLLRVRFLVVGGAPVSVPVMTLWQLWGLPVKEIYGSTEAGLISCQDGEWPQPGNIGKILPWCEFKITADNEFLLRSQGMLEGYWEEEELTIKVKGDGWFHTGDVVEMQPDGTLKMLGCIRDIITTSHGRKVIPSEIERAIKASPYIADVLVLGNGRKYLTALIEIDFDAVSEWARDHGIMYTSFTSLTNHPNVEKLIAADVAKANMKLALLEELKKFCIIPQELNPEDDQDPVTPTRKIKRKWMHERFRDLIESMYLDKEGRIVTEAE